MRGLSHQVIGAAIEVHRHLGPGLLERSYRDCLAWELRERGISAQTELVLPLRYKALRLEQAYRIDMLVQGELILEIKSVAQVHPVHLSQLRSYLHHSGLQEGLLINFNVKILKDGLHQLIRPPRAPRTLPTPAPQHAQATPAPPRAQAAPAPPRAQAAPAPPRPQAP